MTAQVPEQIIIDGEVRDLYAAPLYRLLASRRMTLRDEAGWTTACHRGYCGTWEIISRRLHLVRLDLMCPDAVPIPQDVRRKLLRAASCADFPIPAFWFNGRLRIAIGRLVVYSHHGWSHCFERERVITFVGGETRRDREVDTRSMLERLLRRNPEMRDRLYGTEDHLPGGGWFEDSELG